MTEQEQPLTIEEQLIEERIRKPMRHYLDGKQENEIDLVEIVREKLINVGLKQEVEEVYDHSRFIKEAKGKTSSAQLWNLNRFLTLQFCASDANTDKQRLYLVDTLDVDKWLNIVDKAIIPELLGNVTLRKIDHVE
jgi:hypothetical protein